MRYGQIRRYDIANGLGIRTSIFVTGCTHACAGCFNEEYQDFHAGTPWTERETEEVIHYLEDDTIAGLTLLGGEPFQNVPELTEVVRAIKKQSAKDIWAYSGYTFEELVEHPARLDLLREIDVLVDGRFIEAQKDLTLRFRGSANQRILDVKKSLAAMKAVPYTFE